MGAPIKTNTHKKGIFVLLQVNWQIEKTSGGIKRIVCVENKGEEEEEEEEGGVAGMSPNPVFGTLLCATRCATWTFLCINLSTRKKVHTHTRTQTTHTLGHNEYHGCMGIKRKQTNQNILLYIYIIINLIYNYLSIS